MNKLKILCEDWLYESFGIKGEVTETEILKQKKAVDTGLGLVGVAFEFRGTDGTTGDSVAFFDKNLVEEAIITSIFWEGFTTESAQVWM